MLCHTSADRIQNELADGKSNFTPTVARGRRNLPWGNGLAFGHWATFVADLDNR